MSTKIRQWFNVQASATDPSVADIHIIDPIGSWDDEMWKQFGFDMGVTAKSFVDELSQLPDNVKTINVHINSPGGDVQAGVNIANALRAETAKGRTVNTYVDGIAASIASVIAMAGSKVFIADNGLMMIHNPYGVALGTSDDMRKSAEALDAVRGQIIATYQWHSSLETDAIATLMAAETWMTADEAIANGFATDKVTGLKAAALMDTKGLAGLKIPAQFKDRISAFVKPEEKPAPAKAAASAADVLRACTAGGCLELAEELVTAGATLEQVTARVTETKNAKAAENTRVMEIQALCDKVKLPELARSYIAGGMTVDAVKAQLTIVTAKLDKVELETGIDPDKGARKHHPVDVLGSYTDLGNKQPRT